MTTHESSQGRAAPRDAGVTGVVSPDVRRQGVRTSSGETLDEATETSSTDQPVTDDKTSDAAVDTKGKAKDSPSSVRNQTPHRLFITTAAGERIAFAPLEERAFEPGHLPIAGLSNLGLLKAAETKVKNKSEVVTTIFGAAFVPTIFGGFVIASVVDDNPGLAPWIWIIAAAVVLILMVTAYVVMSGKESSVGRLLAQTTTLVFVLAISVGIPTATVWRFAEEDVFSMSGLDVFVRLSQIAIISVASMLPGLLFFFFDRQKLSTLRNRFERQIFRLDPNVETLADVNARYGRQLEETYGTSQIGESVRLARQRRLPILVGTIVLSISWTIALAPVHSLPGALTPDGIPGVLAPHADPVTFGFLGAYFYALNLVWRRYTRGDLRPKAYSAITVRILIVLVVTWVLAAVAPESSSYILVLAFLIGIVPETVFVLLREWFARSRGEGFALKALEEPQPLQHLEGMDLYDRARLLDEGISNVQALSHHDLVDLLLETRVPTGRLVDWVDQSVLYLHCKTAPESPKRDVNGTAGRDTHGAEQFDMLHRLQRVGIRTATDFEAAMAKNRKSLDATFDGAALDLLLTSLSDDEWLKYIRHWRLDGPVSKMHVAIDSEGRILDGPTLVNQP